MASTPVPIAGANTIAGFNITVPFTTTDQFTFSFPYLSKDDFKIEVKSETVLDAADYEFVSDYLIQLTTIGRDKLNALYTSGTVDLIIYRSTQLTTRLTDFQNGANLTDTELDLQSNQTFYLIQESYDTFLAGTLGKNPVSGAIDSEGAELANIAEPTSETSAASLKTVLDKAVTPDYTNAEAYRNLKMVFHLGDLYRANKDIAFAPAIFDVADWDLVLSAAQLIQIATNTADILTNALSITTHESDGLAHQNEDTEANLTTWALTATNGEKAYATDTKKYYGVEDTLLVEFGGGSGSSIEITVSQVTHGFSVGDGIFHNGASWQKALADSGDTLASYCVTSVTGSNTFKANVFGRVEAIAHGFTVGSYYFQSEITAGLPTVTEPTSGYSNPLFYVEDADNLQLFVYRPSTVRDTLDIDALSDVSAASPINGQVLVFNSTTQIWEAASNPAGVTDHTLLTNIGTKTHATIDSEIDANASAITGKEASLGNPATDGDVLSSTIAGVRSWVTPSAGGGSAGGADTNVQYNDAGAFGGDANFSYNDVTKSLTVKGSTADDTAKSLVVTDNLDAETFSVRNDGQVSAGSLRFPAGGFTCEGSPETMVVQSDTYNARFHVKGFKTMQLVADQYVHYLKSERQMLLYINTTAMMTCNESSTCFGYNVVVDNNVALKTKGWTADSTKFAFQCSSSTDVDLFEVRNDGATFAYGTLNLTGIPTYADEAAAVTGGIATGDVYKTATGELRIKL